MGINANKYLLVQVHILMRNDFGKLICFILV